MLSLIHLTSMEQSLKAQYKNASNISARIRLHKEYSQNKQGWFPWIYEQLPIGTSMKPLHILELGCGNGALWTENLNQLPSDISITLSDISDGMIRDIHRNIGEDSRFHYAICDCHHLPYEDNSYNIVIANHLLFYCEDIHQVCHEVHRVLTSDGTFYCSTYGKQHMCEITELVQGFDSHINLSSEALYNKFGLENGSNYLSEHFSHIELRHYEDHILINQPEPLIEYILSCHGNQNQILLNRFADFRDYVTIQTQKGFHISKDAGIFICKNENK